MTESRASTASSRLHVMGTADVLCAASMQQCPEGGGGQRVRCCTQALNRQQSKDGLLGGPLGGVGKADVQLAGLLETTAAPPKSQAIMPTFWLAPC